VFFPWQMPVNMMARDAWRIETALALGGGLGLFALIAAIIHLSRREVL
jgi:ABC-2 type transport system permease protein